MTDTPYLLLDTTKVKNNIARLDRHLKPLGVGLRPHVKTAKSIEVARLLFDGGTGPITVSTLKEAEAFAAQGFTDITYAVGISETKLDRVIRLRRMGVDLTVLLDSLEQAEAVARASTNSGVCIPALIEIDCDGHRGGLLPADHRIPLIASALTSGGAQIRGVLAHAGESYFCYHDEALSAAAEDERSAAVTAARALEDAGYRCQVVSVGSTPTAHFARDLTGVTEVRAGNFVFFDLVMAGIGVCGVEDIALHVVTTVIGHQPENGWIVTDGGWMATSRDRGTSRQTVDQGYGLVADATGSLYPDLLMTDASQEHGILSMRPGTTSTLPHIPLGTVLRIIPNHACATAAQHDSYKVLDSDGTDIVDTWPRINGW